MKSLGLFQQVVNQEEIQHTKLNFPPGKIPINGTFKKLVGKGMWFSAINQSCTIKGNVQSSLTHEQRLTFLPWTFLMITNELIDSDVQSLMVLYKKCFVSSIIVNLVEWRPSICQVEGYQKSTNTAIMLFKKVNYNQEKKLFMVPWNERKYKYKNKGPMIRHDKPRSFWIGKSQEYKKVPSKECKIAVYPIKR